MKSVTCETTPQTTKQEKKYKELRYFAIKDAYAQFKNDPVRFAPNELDTTYRGRKQSKEKISYRLYRKIVYNYLLMWSYEMLWSNSSIYFWLGGMVKKVKYISGKTKQPCLFFLWYLRPCDRFRSKINFRPLRGSTNKLEMLMQDWLSYNDIDSLPIFTRQIKILHRLKST